MTLHLLLDWIDLNVFASNKMNKCIDTQEDKPKQQEKSLSPEARQIYSNVNKNNGAKHVSAKQRQGQIVDMSLFWNPWHGLEGGFSIICIISNMHTLLYCQPWVQPALHHPTVSVCDWSCIVMDAACSEGSRNRANCYVNMCLFGGVV